MATAIRNLAMVHRAMPDPPGFLRESTQSSSPDRENFFFVAGVFIELFQRCRVDLSRDIILVSASVGLIQIFIGATSVIHGRGSYQGIFICPP